MAVNINVPSQVKTYANLAAFPASGALKTIYIAEDTNKTYRWTGSVYVEVSGADFSGYVPTSRTLTINGTTQDLSADRTFTISTGITIGTTAITSGTVGRVLFEGTGNVVQESANLFWDNTNGRLGIGTSSPSNSLTIKTGVNDDGILLESSVGNPLFLVRKDGTSNSTAELFQYANGSIRLAIRSASNFSYFNGGNFGFGTTTDAGFRLDVNGTARVNGQLTATSVNSSSVGNVVTNQLMQPQGYSGEFRFTNGSGAGWFYTWVQNNGVERMRLSSSNNLLIGTTTDAGFRLDVNGTARIQGNTTITGTLLYLSHTSLGLSGNVGTGVLELFNSSGSAGNTRISLGGITYLNIYQPISSSSGITAGTINTITTPITYAWASGSASPNLFQLNPTYNFTGTYSGIVRGFYYNPTLTSITGVTHYAFHSTSGRVRLEGLPTSPTGLSAGDIWNDGGTLKIV